MSLGKDKKLSQIWFKLLNTSWQKYLTFLVLALSFVTMQNCSSSKFKESSDIGVITETPTAGMNPELLKSSQCNELSEGQTLNSSKLSIGLDNALSVPSGIVKESDILYQSPTGWEASLSKLDLFTVSSWKTSEKKRPVILFIHGGGDDLSDKGDLYTNAPLYHQLYLQKGFLFVNANYRLFLSSKSPNTKFDDQVTDIARAIKWVYNNISAYGGDPSQLVLLGISTGAQIAAMIGSNQQYLQSQGVPLASIKAIISMENSQYDVPLSLELTKGTYWAAQESTIKYVYGETRSDQLKMSPASFLESNSYVKPSLILSSGYKDGQREIVSFLASMNYKNKLLMYGHDVESYHFDDRTEASFINNNSSDEVNQFISSYLDRIFTKSSSSLMSSASERQKVFDKLNETFNTSVNLPGAVYVYISPSLSMAVGCGNRSLFTDKQTPNMNTIFSIGSVTKIFTGLVLAKLVKDNEVSLNDSVVSLLSDSQLKSTLSSGITLQQLVTHSSGLKDMPSNILADRDTNGDGLIELVDILNPAAHYSLSNLIQCLQISVADPWGHCQPRLNKIGFYEYSNYGLGLLGFSLMDQKSNRFASYSHFFRFYLGIPLALDDGFAEADEIKQLFDNLNNKDLTNPDIIQAINLLRSRFAGLHNYSGVPLALAEAPQPDMGMLAGAGELKLSAQSLVKFLRLVLGYQSSVVFSQSILDEYHRSLYNDGIKNLSYAVEISNSPTGSLLYSKTGITKGSSAYLAWSRANQSGLLVLSNSSPDASFWKNSTSSLLSSLSSGN